MIINNLKGSSDLNDSVAEQSTTGTWLEQYADNYSGLLRYRAKYQPHSPAYHFLSNGKHLTRCYTYQQLEQLVKIKAASLQVMGAEGERVLLVMPSDLDYTLVFLACLYAGAIPVTSSVPSTSEQMRRLSCIVHDADAKFIIANDLSMEKLKTTFHDFHDFHGSHDHHDNELFNTNANANASKWLSYAGLAQGNPNDWQFPKAQWQDVAFLQYTSGSTNAPKGVEVTHKNLARIGQYQENLYQCTPNDSNVTWLPQSHDMGLILGVLQPLYTGYPCYLMTPMAFLKKPMNWLQAISDYRASMSIAPNFAYDLCSQRATDQDIAQLDLSCFTSASNGAEPIRLATLENFAARFQACGFDKHALKNGYGLAETSLAVTTTAKHASAKHLQVSTKHLQQGHIVLAENSNNTYNHSQPVMSCGTTQSGVEVVIIPVDGNTDLGQMQVGEIAVRGDTITQGYWKNPEATKKVYHTTLQDGRNGFFRTGDLGFLDTHNELYITGRVKDVIIIYGENYASQDLEYAVESNHPELHANQTQTACFSLDVYDQEQVVLIAEIHQKQLKTVNANALAKAIFLFICREYQVPVYEILLVKRGQCPKTTSGKIQRQRSKQLYLEDSYSVLGSFCHPRYHSFRLRKEQYIS